VIAKVAPVPPGGCLFDWSTLPCLCCVEPCFGLLLEGDTTRDALGYLCPNGFFGVYSGLFQQPDLPPFSLKRS
jgi:hypothetical protein